MTIDSPAAQLLEPTSSKGVLDHRDWDDLAARINAALEEARRDGEQWGRERFRGHLVLLAERSGHDTVSVDFIRMFQGDLP